MYGVKCPTDRFVFDRVTGKLSSQHDGHRQLKTESVTFQLSADVTLLRVQCLLLD